MCCGVMLGDWYFVAFFCGWWGDRHLYKQMVIATYRLNQPKGWFSGMAQQIYKKKNKKKILDTWHVTCDT